MVENRITTEFLTLHGARIEIGPGVLEQLGRLVHQKHPLERVAIITDRQVGSLYADKLSLTFPEPPLVFTFAQGEKNKTRETWSSLTDQLIAAGCGRDTVIVAVGGGVTGDLAGFVAATFMRGIPVVQVPTTLLAMIDASIGGKTGVDTRAGKNLVGAFHQPSLVVIDPRALSTLPSHVMREGLAEAIKHGVIADAAYFGWIAASLREVIDADARDDQTALHLVRRSVEIKVNVVRKDERESGLRKILNFGHTIGHALEQVTAYGIPHGDAVAIGMVAEAMLAERLNIAQPGLSDAIITVCDAAGLPVRLPEGVSPTEIVTAARTDKKARSGQVEYVLPTGLGEMSHSDSDYATRVPEGDVLRVLEKI